MSIYERLDWLAGRVEAPIDPAERIVDPHHHLWDRADSRYLAEELLIDTRGGHNVTHTVFVECSAGYDAAGPEHLKPVGETRFVAGEADRIATMVGADEGRTEIAAIVGHADLRLGDAVDEVLAAHEEAGAGRFRGVRHGTNWSPHPDIKNGHHNPTQGLLLDTDFQAGVRALGARGHTFDAWTYFDQLDELAELARAVPETTIIVDHLGAPLGIGPHAAAVAEMERVWAAGIADVAACPNTVLKVGGIGMAHYFGTDWAERDRPPGSEEVASWWADRVHRCIDAFGPDRCMFESNFPVDRQTIPYGVLWNVFQILADRYRADERASMFAATAERAYRIDP